MRVNGQPQRTIWVEPDGWSVGIIDQTRLPHEFATARLTTVDETARAIRTMQVRGAPLIGVTAAYGIALAMRSDASDASLIGASTGLLATRPTAVNLKWALERVRAHLLPLGVAQRPRAAYALAGAMADEDVETCRSIGQHGFAVLQAAFERRRQPDRLNILTHCNAGWLATVDWGTALAPIFEAYQRKLPIHVWVDETRPRNQGLLTAWELQQQGIPHTVVVDNAGGHLMQHGLVDLCLVGTDRTTARGDVCNKIGTYLKALAARDNGVPFYAAVPGSSIDFHVADGVQEIPIEQRDGREVREVAGRVGAETVSVRVAAETTEVANYAFDVTPARLVTGLITERGVCAASPDGLRTLFPERV
jgi:methylthioribose-1-phosphate isomerase